MSCFDNSTAEDISSIDDSTEDEDPLFGNFEGDATLKKLLSPKKRQRENIAHFTDTKKTRTAKQSPSRSTGDILQQLKSRMGDTLEKELGFSIDNSKSNQSFVESHVFQKLLDEVKKEKEIEDIIQNESVEEMRKVSAEAAVTKWIEDHVNHKFLNAEVSGVRLNQKWISSLRKILCSVIEDDEISLDEAKVRSSLSKYPQYYNFRCFTSNNNTNTPSIGFAEYLIERKKIKTLIYSKEVKYVENFRANGIDGEVPEKQQILEALGCDCDLMLDMNQEALKSFDSKNLLPSLGCGFEILKFVQLINTTRFDIFDKNEVLRILLLLCSDYNAKIDNTHYKYEGKYLTGIEVGFSKVWEFRKDPDLFKMLNVVFRKEPELWFEVIRSFNCTSFTDDLVFKGILTLEYLHKNEPNRIDYTVRDVNFTLEDIFVEFNEYLNRWSTDKLDPENESFLDVIKWKIELIKDWLLATNVIIQNLKINDPKRGLITGITNSLNQLKANYFTNFDKSLNATVPQCKKILDFIYHEISNSEVNDVFAE